MPRRPMLAIRLIAVKTVGPRRVKPSVYLRPTAQPISKRPATKRTIQAMCGLLAVEVVLPGPRDAPGSSPARVTILELAFLVLEGGQVVGAVHRGVVRLAHGRDVDAD